MAVKITPLRAGWVLALIYMFFFAGFLFPQVYPYFRDYFWVLILLTFLVLFSFHKKWNKEFVYTSLLIGICGFLLEVIGIKTGWIFGYFQYGPTLGFAIWDTPVLMFIIWLSNIYLTRQIAEVIAKDILMVCALSSALMLLNDLFLESFAVKNGLWSWNSVQVPFQNYAALFILGVILQYLYIKAVKFPLNKLSLAIYLLQLSFFAGLYILNK